MPLHEGDKGLQGSGHLAAARIVRKSPDLRGDQSFSSATSLPSDIDAATNGSGRLAIPTPLIAALTSKHVSLTTNEPLTAT